MNNNLFNRAAFQLGLINMEFDELFAACNSETEGMDTDDANKVYAAKYKAQYDELVLQSDIIARVYWYTDPDNSRHNKQINHRHTVARMHEAGLHKMSL